MGNALNPQNNATVRTLDNNLKLASDINKAYENGVLPTNNQQSILDTIKNTLNNNNGNNNRKNLDVIFTNGNTPINTPINTSINNNKITYDDIRKCLRSDPNFLERFSQQLSQNVEQIYQQVATGEININAAKTRLDNLFQPYSEFETQGNDSTYIVQGNDQRKPIIVIVKHYRLCDTDRIHTYNFAIVPTASTNGQSEYVIMNHRKGQLLQRKLPVIRRSDETIEYEY